MKYVIIGNSFAGMFAVESIRKHDTESEIWVISREPQHVYSRAMIHEILSGIVEEHMVYLRDWDFYDRMDVKKLLGYEVTGIDPATKTITVDDQAMEYDKLLIATGGTPFVPPLNGLDDIEYHSFTTLSDAQNLKTACQGKHHAVVLGAGLIGLQCAEALLHLGLDVKVVEMADTVLPMALDETASEIVKTELESEGLDIYNGNTIEEIRGSGGRPISCRLRSGDEIPCDVLVVAVGVRPNVGIAKDAGIDIDRGIVVNGLMETNVADIYAAGDCAQGPEIVSGLTMSIPVIPVASNQGMIAGYNMAGVDRTYRGAMSLNALQFGEVQVVSYGFVKDDVDAEVITRNGLGNVYRKAIIKDGRLTGTLLVKDIERAGLYRHLMEFGIDVTPFKDKLLTDEFGVACLPKEVRDEMFTTPQ
jgi:NAD(P)H-nitrite reductase large subunit